MHLGPAARVLGFAGLIPPLAALAIVLAGPVGWRGQAWQAGIVYALAIFAFLGGTWWGLALHAPPARQGPLLLLAVLPPLAAVVLTLVMSPPVAMLLGALLLAMLPADRLLERARLAPPGWLRLRAALSAGLGLSTLALGWAGLRAMGAA